VDGGSHRGRTPLQAPTIFGSVRYRDTDPLGQIELGKCGIDTPLSITHRTAARAS